MSWREQAACIGYENNQLFFKKTGGTHDARKLCAVCPVTAECLAFALDNNIIDGVWGGLSPNQRRSVKNGGTIDAPYRGPGRLPEVRTECLYADNDCCGTNWGYNRGCRSDLCLAAERNRSRAQRQRRKQQAHA